VLNNIAEERESPHHHQHHQQQHQMVSEKPSTSSSAGGTAGGGTSLQTFGMRHTGRGRGEKNTGTTPLLSRHATPDEAGGNGTDM
jgi:hypothetical protein